MGELKTFDGSKKAKTEPLCLHCNLVPQSQHPGLTCPRIEHCTVDENWNIYSIHYLDPRDWAAFLHECKQQE